MEDGSNAEPALTLIKTLLSNKSYTAETVPSPPWNHDYEADDDASFSLPFSFSAAIAPEAALEFGPSSM